MYRRSQAKPEVSRPLSSRERARLEVRAFIKRMEYDNYIKQGLPPEEAARRIGVKVPAGQRLDPIDILRIIQRGTTQKI